MDYIFSGLVCVSPAARVSIDKTLEMFIFVNFFPARHGNPPSGEFLSMVKFLLAFLCLITAFTGLLLKAPLFNLKGFLLSLEAKRARARTTLETRFNTFILPATLKFSQN